jgi:hypothetical protein
MQGQEVERMAQEFLNRRITQDHPEAELKFEFELTDGDYYARLDAAVYFPGEDVWDIYEIKSGSGVAKEHLLDAAFQRLVSAANLNVRDTYIVHINKHYRRAGDVVLDTLFVIENVNQDIRDLCEELRSGREAALMTAEADTPDRIATCLKPKDCPCPRLCHPNLPEQSIYDLPRIGKKASTMRDMGILSVNQIPADFSLSSNQLRYVEAVKRDAPMIDHARVKSALDEMVYPLYFLDYETFNPAVPWYDGYSPYQHIVFQYSLHVFEEPSAKATHYEYLATEENDPALGLAVDLLGRIGPAGSVVVWNKSFEVSRNWEMAQLHPKVASGLVSINERIFDLMEVFSKGYYVHPGFHGSASIKNVLPVLASDLSYEGMSITEGGGAMLAWAEMMSGEMDVPKFEKTRKDLLEYCKLDTWAMVRIWQALLKAI